VTIEIRRFGIGHRRPHGPDGTVGVTGQVIHSDARGIVAELAFARDARIEPHTNPNTTYLVVIEGGGWVRVGEGSARVAAGEAVVWPANVLHSAWTEHSNMRAIVVEFADADDASVRGILEGRAVRTLDSGEVSVSRGEGGLQPSGSGSEGHDRSQGEPI
jgi:quercetin dioxygenase-like cupin family protein